MLTIFSHRKRGHGVRILSSPRSSGNWQRSASRDSEATAISPAPKKKWTQTDQDNLDEEARVKALDALLQSWKERLSLITVISTFFAAMEAQLISGTTPSDPQNTTAVQSAANAGLSGALVVHIFAAIISFLAAFFLIRYELCEAVRQEHEVEHVAIHTTPVPGEPGVFTADPHLEHRGPFGIPAPPINLLRKCNSLCMWLTAIGSVLALMGVLCSTWSAMPESVSIFTSACAGFCLVGLVFAFA